MDVREVSLYLLLLSITYLIGKSDSLRLRKKSHFQSVMWMSSSMQESSMVSRLAPPHMLEKRRLAIRTLGYALISLLNSWWR